jgi:radical SAM superfamily enzyme YgiQ (UPF0313 family)
MRILMIYPEFPDTFWSFKHALRFILKRASFPPLGLLTVASLLPKDWEKRLVDMNTDRLTQHDLEWADYVFVSAMVVQRDTAREVIQRCKQAGVKIVAGGPLFLGEYEKFPEVDHFVLNEAEITLPLFLRDLEQGQPQRVYASDEHADMESSPTPMWELANLRHYASMCVQYSRGCPFNCDFCNITAMFGRRPRIKTAQQIITELNALYDLGWRGGVFFVDDNLIGNRRRLRDEMLPALIAWQRDHKGLEFQTEVSIDLADDPELARMMVEAGFNTIFVGIETPDEQSLAECNKYQNKGRDLVESVKTLQRAGLEVQGGFIVGFDSDTPSIFQRQIDFIQRSGIVTAMVGLLQAPYGTRLYDRLAKEGRLLGELSGNNCDNTMNFKPIMDPHVLHEGYRRIMNYIYSPRAYYERVRTFLREYQGAATTHGAIKWNEIVAFLRSIFVIGVRGKERLEYWRLVFWTLFRRPKLFPYAITFAIYGFHFRRICELYVL